MPTVGWIHEGNDDRYFAQYGHSTEPIVPTYDCHICGEKFMSALDRDRHEIRHPILNPAIFINGAEAHGNEIKITSVVTKESIYIYNIDFLSINGVDYPQSDILANMLVSKKQAFWDVRYGNSSITKRLKVHVCIADPEEIRCVDKAFIHYFEANNLNDSSIAAFTAKVSDLCTVKLYSDGLVRYLQGLMAKDSRAKTQSFQVFAERFNQATMSLCGYETDLSYAVKDVVNFNRNDFASIDRVGIPTLKRAVDFFRGGDLAIADSLGKLQSFPVDYTTEYTLNHLLKFYEVCDLDELEAEIKTISPKYLSLQDRSKLDYVDRKSVV